MCIHQSLFTYSRPFGFISGLSEPSGILSGTEGGFFDLDNQTRIRSASTNTDWTWTGSINLGTGRYYLLCNAYGISSQGPNGGYLIQGGVTTTFTWNNIRSYTINNTVIGLGGAYNPDSAGSRRRTPATPSGSGTLTEVYTGTTGGGFRQNWWSLVFIPDGVGDTAYSDHVIIHTT